MMLGCYDIYLWNEMMRPDSDVVFVGDARNVVASYFICQQMYRLLKAVRLNWRKQQGTWGSRAELDEAAHRYTQRLAEGIMDNGIFLWWRRTELLPAVQLCGKTLRLGYALRRAQQVRAKKLCVILRGF